MADATVSRVERGRLAPSAALLAKLAAALSVSADDLLAHRVPTKPPRMRASLARLLAVAEPLDDGQIDDVRRAVELMLAVGRRTGRRS